MSSSAKVTISFVIKKHFCLFLSTLDQSAYQAPKKE